MLQDYAAFPAHCQVTTSACADAVAVGYQDWKHSEGA